MFCPHCGQQQSSNEIRFCSRCGFPLGNVPQLLANNGVLPGSAGEATKPVSPRRRGVRRGATLLFIGFILTPLLAILSAEFDFTPTIVALSALIFIFGGLLRMVYAALFEVGAPTTSAVEPPAYTPPPVVSSSPRTFKADGAAEVGALPPPRSVPVSAFTPTSRTNTAEMVGPPSVTENTTRLLKDPPDAEPQS